MFSPVLGRAVRSTCAVSGPVSSAAVRPTSVASIAAAAPCIARSSHQRRLSSSKASIPPDSSKSASSPQKSPSNASPRSTEKRSGRSSRKKAAPAMNVPHVPSTDHLKKEDVGLSSFFSLHRPISITSPLPTSSTESSFNSIFEPRIRDNSKFNDTIYTLSTAVEAMDPAYGEGDLHPHVLSQQGVDEVYHLDGVPRLSIDKLVAQYQPFKAPPPPVPVDDKSSQQNAVAKQQTRVARKPKQKSWKTTIVVTESTDSNGSRTYTAATSPMVEIAPEESTIEDPMAERTVAIRQPFLDRMRIRQQRWEQHHLERGEKDDKKMFLISVKRQRKLKMKKHKYKKLMKRTRILRRKLEKS